MNGIPYLGASEKRDDLLLCKNVVLNLIAPYRNRGHSITADNFFTTYNLVVKLLQIKTTYCGTIKKNKPELPSIVKNNKEKLYTSYFFENDGGLLLTVYQGKLNKNIVILSSNHEQATVEENINNKKSQIL